MQIHNHCINWAKTFDFLQAQKYGNGRQYFFRHFFKQIFFFFLFDLFYSNLEVMLQLQSSMKYLEAIFNF